MSILALIVVIFISALIIKIGSTALRMTGIDKETARFQSLSAFTGTGFTTTEAENIVNHPTRRKIVKALMLLGNIGIISVVTTVFLSFRGATLTDSLANIGAIGAVAIVLLLVSLAKGLENMLDRFIEKRLSRMTHFSMGGFSEIVKLASGYGIAEVSIQAGHPITGKKLFESNLSQSNIMVLAIKRGIHLIPTPRANETIEPGDKLLCFGLLKNLATVASSEAPPGVGEAAGA
ncbi:MAG TPA: TrkA C-terminal domain-containing protein [Patescibacteria group bacterium]|nr:TrkA C-terminal domain-containing protein [Patescibacteria group bacterium]